LKQLPLNWDTWNVGLNTLECVDNDRAVSGGAPGTGLAGGWSVEAGVRAPNVARVL